MKKTRVLVCLIMTLLILFPASWVYADEPESATAADSETEVEIEAPSEPADMGTEEGQDIQDEHAAGDPQDAALPNVLEEEKSQEDTVADKEELTRIDDEAVPLADISEVPEKSGWSLGNTVCAALAFVAGAAIVVIAVMKFRKKETAEESEN